MPIPVIITSSMRIPESVSLAVDDSASFFLELDFADLGLASYLDSEISQADSM